MRTIQICAGCTVTVTNRTFQAWQKALEADANLWGWLHYGEADWQDIEEARCEADKAWDAFFGV